MLRSGSSGSGCSGFSSGSVLPQVQVHGARPVEWSGPVKLDGYRNWAFALVGIWDLWARPTVESAYAPEELVLKKQNTFFFGEPQEASSRGIRGFF